MAKGDLISISSVFGGGINIDNLSTGQQRFTASSYVVPRLQILTGKISITTNGGDEGWSYFPTITFSTKFKHIPFISLVQFTGHSSENYFIETLTDEKMIVRQYHTSDSYFTYGYRWYAIGFY